MLKMKRFIGKFCIFIIVTATSSCIFSSGDGSNTLLKKSANNNHSKKAVLFLKKEGATVGDSYQVSITDFDTEFDTAAVGNVFTVDNDHGKTDLNPNIIDFKWISDNALEINYDENLRIFIKEKSKDGVLIIYKPH